MQDLVFFYPNRHEDHSEPGHPERPERVEAIKKALQEKDIWQSYPHLEPITLPTEILHTAHDSKYLHQIQMASQRGQRIDMDTYITPHSWQLALNAAGGAAAIADAVWSGEAKRGFALCRPPGHHATSNQAMGFCIINNIAVAAEYLFQVHAAKKVAIIDIDLHHGNGTQDIFYQREELIFFSIHQLPLYPMSGYLNETGWGKGEGTTVNLPLPPHSGDQARLAILEEIILPLLDRHMPECILISYGFDAHWRDPLGNQLTSADNYGVTVSKLCQWADKNCQGKLALFLEGGYDLTAAGATAVAASQAMLGQSWEDPIGPSPTPEDTRWQPILDQAKEIWKL